MDSQWKNLDYKADEQVIDLNIGVGTSDGQRTTLQAKEYDL